MTTTHLDALIAAADLSDRADRLMLADALEEAGREGEAAYVRSLYLTIQLLGGEVVMVARALNGDKMITRERRSVAAYDWHDDEGAIFPQQVFVVEAETETPAGTTVSVYRWEQHQQYSGIIQYGAWTYDEEEAETDGVAHAEADAN